VVGGVVTGAGTGRPTAGGTTGPGVTGTGGDEPGVTGGATLAVFPPGRNVSEGGAVAGTGTGTGTSTAARTGGSAGAGGTPPVATTTGAPPAVIGAVALPAATVSEGTARTSADVVVADSSPAVATGTSDAGVVLVVIGRAAAPTDASGRAGGAPASGRGDVPGPRPAADTASAVR
jgi:hypothetical protein